MKWAGEHPGDLGVVIFQKVMPWARSKLIQILDVCDPFWRESGPGATFSLVDAVTCPTEALAEEIRGITEVPVHVVRDGHDFSVYPRSTNRNAEYVWFGYSQNFPAAAYSVPEELLTVVSDRDCGYGGFVPWRDDSEAWEQIARASIAVLPQRESWKSNNKEISARAMGLAIAKTAEDIERFRCPDERAKDWRDVSEWSAARAGTEMRRVIETVRTT